MSGWTPADSGAVRRKVEEVMARVAAAGAFEASDVEEIMDQVSDYGSDRYSDGCHDEGEARSW